MIDSLGEEQYCPVVVSIPHDRCICDFYVADGADVAIVAGCGIHNGGCNDSRHDGIHTFHVGKNANVRYEEKHYGEGNGTGQRILNPVTNIEIGENSVFTLDTVQIKGVDSTIRTTNVVMDANSKLFVLERLMTDGDQKAESDIEVCMNGSGSSAQIISRSVGKGNSSQVFHPKAVGKNKCHAHIQCDSIIMDHAQVGSIPEIQAKHVDAAIIQGGDRRTMSSTIENQRFGYGSGGKSLLKIFRAEKKGNKEQKEAFQSAKMEMPHLCIFHSR